MRVTGTFNNSLNSGRKSSASSAPAANAKQADKVGFGPRRERAEVPGQESLSRAEILRRIENQKNPKKEEAAATTDITAGKIPVEDERPAQLVRPIWDDAGEDDPPPVKSAEQAVLKAQELAGASVEKAEVKTAAKVEEKSETKSSDDKGDTIKIVEEVKSDVGLNRPDDPQTKNKLKHVLSTGAFQFSEKEKEALKNILGDQ